MAQTASRMNHIFGTDGKTFILAMDHGSNFNVLPAMKDAKTLIRELAAAGADAFLSTIGMAENFAGSFLGKGIILRIDGGVSFLGDHRAPMQIVATAEDALRLGADSVITMSFPGSVHEAEVLSNLARVCLDCHKWGMPVTAEALPRGFEKGRGFPHAGKHNVCLPSGRGARRGHREDRLYRRSGELPDADGKRLCPGRHPRRRKKGPRTGAIAGDPRCARCRSLRRRHGAEHLGNEDPVRYAAAIAKLIHEDCSVDAALKEMNRLY